MNRALKVLNSSKCERTRDTSKSHVSLPVSLQAEYVTNLVLKVLSCCLIDSDYRTKEYRDGTQLAVSLVYLSKMGRTGRTQLAMSCEGRDKHSLTESKLCPSCPSRNSVSLANTPKNTPASRYACRGKHCPCEKQDNRAGGNAND